MSLSPKAPFPCSRRVLCLPRRSVGEGGLLIPQLHSRSVATGGGARVATGKRSSFAKATPNVFASGRRDKRGGAGAHRIGQDLHLRAALSRSENSGGVHRPDPRVRKYRSIALVDRLAQPARLPLQKRKPANSMHHKRLMIDQNLLLSGNLWAPRSGTWFKRAPSIFGPAARQD
jgi:hypothetical protein